MRHIENLLLYESLIFVILSVLVSEMDSALDKAAVGKAHHKRFQYSETSCDLLIMVCTGIFYEHLVLIFYLADHQAWKAAEVHGQKKKAFEQVALTFWANLDEHEYVILPFRSHPCRKVGFEQPKGENVERKLEELAKTAQKRLTAYQNALNEGMKDEGRLEVEFADEPVNVWFVGTGNLIGDRPVKNWTSYVILTNTIRYESC